MNQPSRTLVAVITLLAFSTTQVFPQVIFTPSSDPKESREDARKIAVKFRDRGYNITAIANGNNFNSLIEFDLELTKGLDCVIMVGIDNAMPDVDLYVKDDVGNMIAQDTRTIRRACVEFTASSNGVYTFTVKATKSEVIGHFTILGGFQPSGYN